MFLRIRIEIQVILLILQLETDYFSSYSFQKCSIRSSGSTVFTETSRTAILHEEILQDSSAPIPAPISAPILQGYPSTTTYREFSIQNPTLHAETKSSSSTITTYRGQRDLHSRKEILRIEGKEIF